MQHWSKMHLLICREIENPGLQSSFENPKHQFLLGSQRHSLRAIPTLPLPLVWKKIPLSKSSSNLNVVDHLSLLWCREWTLSGGRPCFYLWSFQTIQWWGCPEGPALGRSREDGCWCQWGRRCRGVAASGACWPPGEIRRSSSWHPWLSGVSAWYLARHTNPFSLSSWETKSETLWKVLITEQMLQEEGSLWAYANSRALHCILMLMHEPVTAIGYKQYLYGCLRKQVLPWSFNTNLECVWDTPFSYITWRILENSCCAF